MIKRITDLSRRECRLPQRQRHSKGQRLLISSVLAVAATVVTAFAVPSVASAQEDSLSSKVSSAAPESCLSWYQWANPYNADADSKNSVDRMMAEPDVNKFCKDFTDKLGQLPAILIPDGAPPRMQIAVETLAPQLVDGLLRNQGCFFVEGFELTPEPNAKNLKLGFVLELSDNADQTIGAIKSLLNLTDAPLENVTIGVVAKF